MSRKASSSKPRALVNPAGAVRTAADERRWTKAKELAKKEGRGGDWAYVMGIFKKSRKNPAPAAIKLPPLPKGKRGAVKAIQKLVEVIGPGFHPDTPPEEIVHMDSGKPALTKRQQAHLRTLLDACFILLNDEVYEVALEAAHKALGWDTRVNPSELGFNADEYDFVKLVQLQSAVTLAQRAGAGDAEEVEQRFRAKLAEGILGHDFGGGADWAVSAWEIGINTALDNENPVAWFVDNEDGTYSVLLRTMDDEGEISDSQVAGPLSAADGSMQEWLTRIASETGTAAQGDLFYGRRPAGRRVNPSRRREGELNALEAGLSPEEYRDFEDMILSRYTIRDFAGTQPEEARLALRFREAMREREGDYGWKAVNAVPAEHVRSFSAAEGGPPEVPGRLMLIFEDVAGSADAVQFSRKWQQVEQATGAWMESYNTWSASIYKTRKNPEVEDLNEGLHARIAKALGWSMADVRSMSLASLREVVRPVNAALAHEMDQVIRGDTMTSPARRRRNPAPAPGTPKPSMARVATIARQAGVNPSQARDFLTGFAYEWEEHGGGMDDGAIAQIVLDHLAENARYYRGRK